RVSHRVFVNGVSVAEGMPADSSSAGRVKGVFTLVSVPGISSGIHPPGASGVSAPGGAAAGSAVQHGGRMVIDIEHIAAPSTPPELVPMLEDPASNHHLTDLGRARLALHFAVGLAGRPSAEQEINSGVDMGDQHLGLTTAEWRELQTLVPRVSDLIGTAATCLEGDTMSRIKIGKTRNLLRGSRKVLADLAEAFAQLDGPQDV
ncbi:unnamed protein product, partial [Prorocentrum cordatum]